MKNGELENVFYENFIDYIVFGRSGYRVHKDKIENLEQKEIQILLDSDFVINYETLSREDIISNYGKYLSKEQIQKLNEI